MIIITEEKVVIELLARNAEPRYTRKRERINDGHYSVYYLPEHHYVGMTNCVYIRMQEHRLKNKRFTEGYEIIGVYKNAVDAHLTETFLHSMGYKGFYYKGIKDE